MRSGLAAIETEETKREFEKKEKDLQEKQECNHRSQAGGCPTTGNGRAARPLGQPHSARSQKVEMM